MNRSSSILGALLALVLVLVFLSLFGDRQEANSVEPGAGEASAEAVRAGPSLDPSRSNEPDAEDPAGPEVQQVTPVRTAVDGARTGLRIEVVAAVTGQPVERFGLHLVPVASAPFFRRSQLERAALSLHPDGITWVDAEPAEDLYCIHAPGFGAHLGTLVPGAGGGARIELPPEGRLTGRLLVGEEPVAGTWVKLERHRFEVNRMRSLVTERSPEPELISRSYDLDRFAGLSRGVRTDAGGRFDFGGLAAGTYDLMVDGGDHAPFAMELLAVEAGQVTRLADAQLEPEVALEVQVVAPWVANLTDVEVVLTGSPGSARARFPGADGSLRFDNLAPGLYRLSIEDRDEIVLGMTAVDVEVVAGGANRVLLDLALWRPVQVEVLVRGPWGALADMPVHIGLMGPDGWTRRRPYPSQVENSPLRPSGDRWGRFQRPSWGDITDEQGRMRFWLPTSAVFHVLAGHPSEALGLHRSSRTAVELPVRVVDLVIGRLHIDLPPVWLTDPNGRLVVRIERADGLVVARRKLRVMEGRVADLERGGADGVELDALQPGAYTVVVEHESWEKAIDETYLPQGGGGIGPEAGVTYRAEVEIIGGVVATCAPELEEP